MSLYSLTDLTPEFFVICLINSSYMSFYVNDFVNNTQTFQINDARQLPIIIPTIEQLNELEKLFDLAIQVKKAGVLNQISENKAENRLFEIQDVLDKKVKLLYGF